VCKIINARSDGFTTRLSFDGVLQV